MFLEIVYFLFLVSGLLKSFALGFGVHFPIDITLAAGLLLIGYTAVAISKSNKKFFNVIIKDTTIKLLPFLLLFTWISISLVYSSSDSYKYVKYLGGLTNALAFLIPFWNRKMNVNVVFKGFLIFTVLISLIFFFAHPIGLYVAHPENIVGWINFDVLSISYLGVGEYVAISLIGLLFIKGQWNSLIRILLINYFLIILFYSGARGPMIVFSVVVVLGFVLHKFLEFRFESKDFFAKNSILSIILGATILNIVLIGLISSDEKKMLVCQRSFNRLGLMVNLVGEDEANKMEAYVSDFDVAHEGMESLYESNDTDKEIKRNKSIVARVIHYRFSKEKILSSPRFFLFGFGFGSYSKEFTDIDKRGYPHNTVLEIWFELGLLGVILFMLVFRRFLLFPLTVRNLAAILIFTFCFLNSMKSNGFEDLRILFGITGIAFFSRRLNKNNNVICHISTVHQGMDTRIYFKECLALSKEGFDVNLVITGEKEMVDSSGKVKFLLLKPNNSFLTRISNSFLFGPIKAISTNANIYHFHDPELMPIGLLFKFFGAKVVFDFHELVYVQLNDKELLGGGFIDKLIKGAYLILEKASVRAFDKIVLAEAGYRDYFERNYQQRMGKVEFIQNFPMIALIDNSKKVSLGHDDKFVLFYAGGITKIRGILEIVKAANLIDDVKLVIVGKWDDDSYWEECQAADKNNVIDYRGFVNMDEVYPLMKCADAGIANLFPKDNYLTSLPVKVFEYMACSLPLIMSDFPYWKTTFAECALFVSPENSEDIANKIELLKRDSSKRTEMGEKSRKTVEDLYSWENEKEKLIEMYKSIND